MLPVMIDFIDEVVLSTVEDELILIDQSRGRYYAANRSASLIIHGLLHRSDIEDIARSIASEHDVQVNTVISHVEAVIHTLTNFGLILER